MGRGSVDRGELLLEVLRALERRPMSQAEIAAELDGWNGLAIALTALRGEALIEAVALRGEAVYRITDEGVAAVAQRTPVNRREHVAILFTDVVGSTELLDRLGDEAAHDVRREHFARLREAVREHDGREVKSLGDGLMVAFEHAPAAVACALAMQRAVRGCDEPLGLRIGIAAGEAVREGDDYFGRPVIVARRLCDAARGGDVLVSESLHELLTGSAAQRVKPLGPLSLKGLREPVAASVLQPQPLALRA